MAETSVVFLPANGAIDGAQQTVSSPDPTSLVVSMDVLVCTSTTRLEISMCTNDQGSTSCAALQAPEGSRCRRDNHELEICRHHLLRICRDGILQSGFPTMDVHRDQPGTHPAPPACSTLLYDHRDPQSVIEHPTRIYHGCVVWPDSIWSCPGYAHLISDNQSAADGSHNSFCDIRTHPPFPHHDYWLSHWPVHARRG